ncbi:MAG: hypothetical protein ACPG49_03760 [Chitinophagales bacterium]
MKTVIGLSLLLFLLPFVVIGFNEEATRAAIQWSARISFGLFCSAFAASSIHKLLQTKWTHYLLNNRRYIGISFALIHLIHLGFLILLQYRFYPVFDLAAHTSIAAGSMAYLFIVLMLLTSFPKFSKYLTTFQWKTLHTVGGYWVWVIFMSSYLKRSMTEYIHIPLVADFTYHTFLANLGFSDSKKSNCLINQSVFELEFEN